MPNKNVYIINIKVYIAKLYRRYEELYIRKIIVLIIVLGN